MEYTHDFKLEAGNLKLEGEIDISSGIYTENQPEEFPANLEIDFKQMVEIFKKFHSIFGSIEFEVKPK